MTSWKHRSFRLRRQRGANLAFSLLLALAACFTFVSFARAAATLEPIPGLENKQSMQTGETVSLKLRYTDPNGDDISKSTATMIDEGPDGRKTFNATDLDGNDTSKGVTITWQINGFAAGPHQAYFQVNPVHPTGHTARYPEGQTYFTFGVEAPWVKYLYMGGGAVICLLILPLFTYLLFRSLNPRSDPSRAARGALFVGILLLCALGIYLFSGVIGLPLVIGIAVVVAIIGIIIVFGRR